MVPSLATEMPCCRFYGSTKNNNFINYLQLIKYPRI
jgi:hypothetical protein